jgi:hypothetical protein
VYAVYRTHDAVVDSIAANEPLAAQPQKENDAAKKKSSEKAAPAAGNETAAPCEGQSWCRASDLSR